MTDNTPNDLPETMTPAEVAQLFRVDVKTVTRWAKARRLSSTRTLGGHRRYSRKEIMALHTSGEVKRHNSGPKVDR